MSAAELSERLLNAIRAPHLSEKALNLAESGGRKQLAFRVATTATKPEIAEAGAADIRRAGGFGRGDQLQGEAQAPRGQYGPPGGLEKGIRHPGRGPGPRLRGRRIGRYRSWRSNL